MAVHACREECSQPKMQSLILLDDDAENEQWKADAIILEGSSYRGVCEG